MRIAIRKSPRQDSLEPVSMGANSDVTHTRSIVRAWRSSDRTRLILTLGVVIYVTRVIAPIWRGGYAAFFPDTSSYVAVTRLGPFDPSFWWSERPIGVPLVLWLSGNNSRVFLVLQATLFALALAHLCWVVLKVLSSRVLAWITCATVVSLGVHPRFGLWHLEILSESLSLTLSILMFSTWILFSFEGDRRRLVHAVAVTTIWMAVRDVHIVFGVVVAAALTLSALVFRNWTLRRTAATAAAVLVGFSSYVLAAQSISDRNLHPLINTIGERVLPDPDITATFVDRGMPLDDALAERAGSDAWSDDQAFLLSPNLERFRSWAKDDGRQALMTSLLVDASFWIDTSRQALAASLPLDFTEYDRHAVSERLPTRLFWFQGPRTPQQLEVWGAAAAVGFAILLVRRRRLALAGVVALVATCADIVVSVSGDSVEVQRHLLGSILRLSLLLILVVAFATQSLLDRFSNRTVSVSTSRVPISRSSALFTALGSVGTFGTWIALEHRSRDFDPQYARTIVERAARFGGTYYQNGVHNKGPLETAVYDSVRLFTNYDTYWFGISAYIIAVSLVLGAAGAMVARVLGASRRVAGTMAALVFVHFTLSNSDYAGVLYSRNITTAILALVVTATSWSRPWEDERRARIAFACLFALLGLAVQTLLTTIFAAVVVGTFLYVRRSSASGRGHPLITAVVSATAAFLSAPAWYALRGSFDEFWSNWWTYAGYMSSSTGRSLLDQIGLGYQQMVGYYQDRPGVVIVILVFVLLARRNWPSMTTTVRTLHITLLAWLGAGWIELVLSQRYSSHYFSIVAVPTALITIVTVVATMDLLGERTEFSGAAVGSSSEQWGPAERKPSRVSPWLPLASVIALLATQGTDSTWNAIEGAGAFRNAAHYVRARENQRSGRQVTHQAVMDLVSEPDDPLLAWTMYPWTYLDHRRVPATRFSWKSFLIGEIYLGRTSPEYVMDGTWRWFAEDLDESRPRVYARPQVTALAPPTPFSDVVSKEFVSVYSDNELEIGWRRDLWDLATRPFEVEDKIDVEQSLPAQWNVDAQSRLIGGDLATPPWTIPLSPCGRLGARLVRTSSTSPAGLRFDFAPSGNIDHSVSLSLDFDRSWSERSDVSGPQTAIELQSSDLKPSQSLDLAFTLLVTESAAALVVDEHIVAAVELDGPASVSVVPIHTNTSMSVPVIDSLDTFAGCHRSTTSRLSSS